MPWVGEPTAHPAEQVDALQMTRKGVGVEEELSDEATEVLGELVFLRRDQRGVWNRGTQWVAEQRRHGEPVGEPTDHRGFTACPQELVSLVRGRNEVRRHEQRQCAQ